MSTSGGGNDMITKQILETTHDASGARDLNNESDEIAIGRAAGSLAEKYAESFDRKMWMPADEFRKIMYEYVREQ
jgi:hypothetical protein